MKISKILICAYQCEPFFKNEIKYLKLDLKDVSEEDLSEHFDKAYTFLAEPGATLVHCRSGISRSASMVISYLIKHYKLSAVDAFYYVKKKRPSVLPNLGFQKQLKAYQTELGITESPVDWEELIGT